MNCKKGDLAIIIRSYAGNEGLIVECLEYLAKCPYTDATGIRLAFRGKPDVWRVRSQGSLIKGTLGEALRETYIEDWRLRPIRPDAEPTQAEKREPLTAIA